MNTMISTLMEQLHSSKTAYHAVACASQVLDAAGYTMLNEGEVWQITRGGKYYVVRDGSALIAFVVGEEPGGFRVVASHLDSPCLKVKGNTVTYGGGCAKLNVEKYGGGLLYTWLDRPLQLAGRVVKYDRESGTVRAELVTDTRKLVIPSVAIHFNREANTSLALNPQVDMQPIVARSRDFLLSFGKEGDGILDADMFVVAADAPFLAGNDEEFLVSPRIDNLTSAFASIAALATGKTGVSVAYLADNEEVGSRTKQGAASDFLHGVMARIAGALGEDLATVLPDSFLISCDNAHAVHPNHPEKSDPANPVLLGGGIVIKHHANQNYTTDAFSSAVFKAIMEKAGVAYQDFYMRADMPCGGTLGAISSSQVSIRSVDIGLAQLAMHSAVETVFAADYEQLIAGLSAFYLSDLRALSCMAMAIH